MIHSRDYYRTGASLVLLFLLGFPLQATEDLTPEEAVVLQESIVLQDSSPRGNSRFDGGTPLSTALAEPSRHADEAEVQDETEVSPIDFLAVLSLAGGNDLEIQFLRNRLREAYADEKLAYVRYFPNVSVFSEFLKHEGRIQGTVGDLPRASKQSLFTGIGLDWVYDFSHELYEKLAVRQTREAHDADFEAVREQRLYRAGTRFFDLVGARANEQVALESVRRGKALVGFEESLVKRGKALEADLARARAFRAERAQDLADARATTQVSSLALATQLRLNPFVRLEPVEGAAVPIRLVEQEGSREELVRTALGERPELLRERYLQSAAQTRREAAAKKRFLPRLSGSAAFGGFGGDAGSGLNEFDDRQDYRLTLDWATDHLGKGDRAILERNEALLGQARVRQEQIEDQVTEEVLVALANVRANEEKMDLSREQVEAAAASVSLTESRLREGLAIPYEVIQAQEALVRAQTNQVQSIVEFNKSQLGLLRSLGGIEGLLVGDPRNR